MTTTIVLCLFLAIAICLLFVLGRWLWRGLDYINDLEGKSAELSKDLEKSKSELKLLRDAIAAASNLSDVERHQFKKALDDLRMKIQDLRKEIQKGNKEIVSLQRDNDELRKENHFLANKVNTPVQYVYDYHPLQREFGSTDESFDRF